MDGSQVEESQLKIERVVKEGDLTLIPGQLLHTVHNQDQLHPSTTLQRLLSASTFEGGRYYSDESAFSFHVTGTESLPAGLKPTGSYSIANNERPIALVMKPTVTEQLAHLVNDSFLKGLISGAEAGDSIFMPGTWDYPNAIRELGDLGISFRNLKNRYPEHTVNQFLYSIFVAKFYQKYNQTGVKDYMGVKTYPGNTDGIVAPGFGIRAFAVSSEKPPYLVQPYLFKAEDIAGLVIREEIAQEVKQSLTEDFQPPIYVYPTLALLT